MKTNLATKIDPEVKESLDLLCKERGLKISYVVEEALKEKLEEMLEEEALRDIAVESLAETGEFSEKDYHKLLKQKKVL